LLAWQYLLDITLAFPSQQLTGIFSLFE